jgi:hypothetical protein
LFGRERLGLGIPYPPEKSCEDAESFFDRMAELDIELSKKMNAIHEKEAIAYNKDKKTRDFLSPGDKVWYRKPKSLSSTSKLESRWTGPMKVTQRKGARSYQVKDMYGIFHDCHLEDLKPYIGEQFPGTPEYLEFQGPTPSKKEDSLVGHVIDHRLVGNDHEFLVTWGNEDRSEGVWETPPMFMKYGQLPVLWDYCQTHGIPLDISHIIPPRTPPDIQA